MVTLIVTLAVSLTLNFVFVAVFIIALLRSKSSLSAISTVNVNVSTEIPQPKPLAQKAVDIYTFIDPNNGQVKYVGQSVNVQQRVSQHIRAAITSGAMSKWLIELYAQGQLPIVKIVASGLTRNEARNVEKQYIREYIGRGEKLFNKESINVVPEVMHRIQIERPE